MARSTRWQKGRFSRNGLHGRVSRSPTLCRTSSTFQIGTYTPRTAGENDYNSSSMSYECWHAYLACWREEIFTICFGKMKDYPETKSNHCPCKMVLVGTSWLRPLHCTRMKPSHRALTYSAELLATDRPHMRSK